MNTKITLGNTMNDLALLKLEHEKLRSMEDRRHAESDFASAELYRPDKDRLGFDSAASLVSSLSKAIQGSNGSELASALAYAGQGLDLVAQFEEETEASNKEVTAILDSIPEAQARADFLSLLDGFRAVLTGQKPTNG